MMVTNQHSQVISSVISIMKNNIKVSKNNAIVFFPYYKDSIEYSFFEIENSIIQVEQVISDNFSDISIKNLQPSVYSTFISYFDEILNNIRKTIDRIAFKNANIPDIAMSVNMDFYEIQDAKFAFVDFYNQIHWPK